MESRLPAIDHSSFDARSQIVQNSQHSVVMSDFVQFQLSSNFHLNSNFVSALSYSTHQHRKSRLMANQEDKSFNSFKTLNFRLSCFSKMTHSHLTQKWNVQPITVTTFDIFNPKRKGKSPFDISNLVTCHCYIGELSLE